MEVECPLDADSVAMRRTVKLAPAPPLFRRMTTPSNTCVRSRSPSTTFALTRTVSPGPNGSIASVSIHFDEIAYIHDAAKNSGRTLNRQELPCYSRGYDANAGARFPRLSRSTDVHPGIGMRASLERLVDAAESSSGTP